MRDSRMSCVGTTALKGVGREAGVEAPEEGPITSTEVVVPNLESRRVNVRERTPSNRGGTR